MRVGVDGARNGANGLNRRRQAGAAAAIFFIWLILLVSRMRLPSSTAAVHRKPHIFPTEGLFKPPAGRGGARNDVVYEDDKRVVHTGPNPLHN